MPLSAKACAAFSPWGAHGVDMAHSLSQPGVMLMLFTPLKGKAREWKG